MSNSSNYDCYIKTGSIKLDEAQVREIKEILTDDLFETHEKILGLRRVAGLSQVEFADILKVKQTSVSQWESGKKKPRAEALIKLADLYDVDIKEFLSAFGFVFK